MWCEGHQNLLTSTVPGLTASCCMTVHRYIVLLHKLSSFVCDCMQAVLLALPDGYLCREQEGELKYMLAFQEPTRAAEWCLIMQVRDDTFGRGTVQRLKKSNAFTFS